MNTYELTVVYSPKLSEEKQKQALKVVEALVDKYQGKVVSKDHWGKKELAYLIGKHSEGFYAGWLMDLPPEGPNQIAKQLAVDETVLRYLVVKTSEDKSTTSTTSTKGTKSMRSIKSTTSNRSTTSTKSMKGTKETKVKTTKKKISKNKK